MKKKTQQQRTVRRTSLPLNKGKWQNVSETAGRYADEKNIHLRAFGSDGYFSECVSDRTRRDALVADRYVSPEGLQARMWKMSLKDAYETVAKNHAALAVVLCRNTAGKDSWNNCQKRYANWLIYTPKRQAELVSGTAPVPPHFVTEYSERRPVISYLRRVIRRKKGGKPRVKKARSVCLDANMYEIFVHNGVQYIKIMSLRRGKRTVIPLTGNTPIKGNIRIILDEEKQRIEIHYTAKVKKKKKLQGGKCGLDAGITEVFTDEQDNRYGQGFGRVLTRASDYLKTKGQKRNRLHQVRKKTDNRKKAANLEKFNLGRKKQKAEKRKLRTELEKQINTAVNQIIKKRSPSLVITEKLDIRGKAKSKKMSRLVSLWTRKILNERTEFKASAEGFRREQVNPAYSSQTCPVCGYPHRKNRRGDAFQCLKCGHADCADRVAAHNLKARYRDTEITLRTPKERVKLILLDRFTADWKPPSGGDCSGQDFSSDSAKSRTESETAGGNQTKSPALNMFEYI